MDGNPIVSLPSSLIPRQANMTFLLELEHLYNIYISNLPIWTEIFSIYSVKRKIPAYIYHSSLYESSLTSIPPNFFDSAPNIVHMYEYIHPHWNTLNDVWILLDGSQIHGFPGFQKAFSGWIRDWLNCERYSHSNHLFIIYIYTS